MVVPRCLAWATLKRDAGASVVFGARVFHVVLTQVDGAPNLLGCLFEASHAFRLSSCCEAWTCALTFWIVWASSMHRF